MFRGDPPDSGLNPIQTGDSGGDLVTRWEENPVPTRPSFLVVVSDGPGWFFPVGVVGEGIHVEFDTESRSLR